MKLLQSTIVLFLLSVTLCSAQKNSSYSNFPENFEQPDTAAKSHYKKEEVKLKTGQWVLDQAILAAVEGKDRFNPTGKQCIRMQQNRNKSAYLEMNFDLTEGASKVTLLYGSYYKDPSCTWRLEYSTDGGSTWQQAGADVTDASAEAKTATFSLNVKGKVRFRINKLGLGDGKADPAIKNGRLSIDDFNVYKN